MDKHWATLSNEQRTLLKRHALSNNHHNIYNYHTREVMRAHAQENYALRDVLLEQLFKEAYSIHPRYLQVVYSLIRSRQRKAKTIKDRITQQLELGQAYFITLTFTNDVFKSTNESTRRKYVSRLLKSISAHYVANIDYGKKRGREHYHAVSNAPLLPGVWLYGRTWCQEIGKTDSAPVSIGRYITKLTNHALKDTTKGRSRFRTVIYSRNV